MTEQQPTIELTTGREGPCPICGQTDYEWGKYYDSDIRHVYFRANRGAVGDGKKVLVRHCKACGNLQTFTPEAKS